jgi:glycerophosphoryl diester phosphodiesterase
MGFAKLVTLIFISLVAIGIFYLDDSLEPGVRSLITAPKPKSYLDEFNRPALLSHRGSRYLGPENTIFMHQTALDIGTDVMEFDVRLTKDNQLVVFHDSTVDRTTNAIGLVKDFNLEELRGLDLGFRYSPNLSTNSTSLKHNDHEMDNQEKRIFDPNTYAEEKGVDVKKSYPYRGLGIKISTLDEFLDALPDSFKNIEIKDENNLSAELLWKAIEKRSGQAAKMVVISRFCSVLQHFRSVSNNKVATAACEGEVVPIVIAAKAHVSNILFTWFKSIPHALAVLQIPTQSGGITLDTPEVISAIHKLGLKVHYWVVNDAAAMKRILSSGADGIITDRIDLAVQVANELGIINRPSKVPQSSINTTNAYFVPSLNPEEVHHCISALCLLVQNFQYIAGAVVVLVFYLSTRKSRSSSPKKVTQAKIKKVK